MIPGQGIMPTICRTVVYVLTKEDADRVNRRRVMGAGHGSTWPEGAQAHVGNHVDGGQKFPLLVTRTFKGYNAVNGQVFLDGNDSLWVMSAKEGTVPGTWHWPDRS